MSFELPWETTTPCCEGEDEVLDEAELLPEVEVGRAFLRQRRIDEEVVLSLSELLLLTERFCGAGAESLLGEGAAELGLAGAESEALDAPAGAELEALGAPAEDGAAEEAEDGAEVDAEEAEEDLCLGCFFTLLEPEAEPEDGAAEPEALCLGWWCFLELEAVLVEFIGDSWCFLELEGVACAEATDDARFLGCFDEELCGTDDSIAAA